MEKNTLTMARSIHKCPNGDKVGEAHAYVSTEKVSHDDMDEIMYTLKIEANAKGLFDGFKMITNGSTKSYLESALTTPTQADRSVTSGRSAKSFHQQIRSIPTSYIILNNHSTVDVFCNPTLLMNISASDQTLHLIRNTVTVPVNQFGDLPGYGTCGITPRVLPSSLDYPTSLIMTSTGSDMTPKRAIISSSPCVDEYPYHP